MDIFEEIADLKRLLQLEKEADLERHRQRMREMPLPERVKEGYSWYPLEIGKKGFTLGGRAYVIVHRSAHEQAHRFRSGNTVNLFTQQSGQHKPERTGIIQFVDRKRMKIVLNQSDWPDWLNQGMIGVDLTFDERTYLEMEKALKQLESARGDRLAELRDIILGKKDALHHPMQEEGIATLYPQLNPSQQQAVSSILAAKDIAVIHGPPGTGKTTTLIAAAQELCKREPQILVSAPSNTAVDVMTTRLAEAGLRVVRIGNISRVDERILPHTLEVQTSNHPESKNIKKLRTQAADMRRKAARYKRKFGQEQAKDRRNMFREAGQLSAWARQLEERILLDILDQAQVIAATLVGCANPVLENRQYHSLIIDEAAQALEPACWIPIQRVERVILAGDPFQLPPTVQDRNAQMGGLGKTLIEKYLERTQEGILLNIQYRMHQSIMEFSNQQFYQGQLQADESVAQHQLSAGDKQAVLFIDTAGSGFSEKERENVRSRYNPEEWQILREDIYQLLQDHVGLELPEIALISPYREQVEWIKKAVEEDDYLKDSSIRIQTIDGFQGQESDAVYISLVRSNDRAEIGFLKDYRRMNVAMTRARKRLVVIGDSATIGADPFYAAFLEYVDQMGGYRTVWEYMT